MAGPVRYAGEGEGYNLRRSGDESVNVTFCCGLNIQGVTGGTDQTSGECSLGQTIPI